MHPIIKKRLFKTITWYKCIKVLPNLDKVYADPIEVSTYYWVSDSVVHSEQGLVTVTQKKFYFDRSIADIGGMDKIVVDGAILAVNRIEEYNNPITHENCGVIVC